MGDRRAQVAERAVRLGPRVLRASGCASRRDRASAPTTSCTTPDADRDQLDWNPEFSRRARGFPIYAALRSLGRSGVAELVSARARTRGAPPRSWRELPGCEVLNEVVLNQVLFRFDTDERTQEALHAVQQSGEAWLSGTTWDDRPAIRVSVSNWQTSDADMERLVEAFRAAVAETASI